MNISIIFQRFVRLAGAVLLMGQLGAQPVFAQVLSSGEGRAGSVDLVEAARTLSMQDAYARALFLYIRSNPAVMNDQQFYVGLVSYLLSTQIGQDCRKAFANEFERRDYYTRAFQVQPQVQQIIAGKTIPQRFEVSYRVTTNEYDFQASSLPFGNIRSIGQRLDRTIGSDNAQSCAHQMLQGTNVDVQAFPWHFTVIDESGQSQAPQFPFVQSLQLGPADARTLFQQFGRQLYSIVAYQVLAASDGSHRVQVIPTDAQLFGLSDTAVVRVQTYAHPTLSQPNYLDIASQLTVRTERPPQQQGYNAYSHIPHLDVTVTLQQDGFRAVATGVAQSPGTGVTAGGTRTITGSAAVGASSFIMRMSAPQLTGQVQGLSDVPGAQRFLTVFGEIDFNNVTTSSAPILGQAMVLQVAADGTLSETQPFPITGEFTPLQASAQAEPDTPTASE